MRSLLSPLLGPLMSSPAMRAIYDDRRASEAHARFRDALARGDAAINVIPQSVVARIAQACVNGAAQRREDC